MTALVLAALIGFASAEPAGTSLADELRRARDEAAPLEDRLAAARRAHAFAATAETNALVKAAFLDVEHEQLARARVFERLRASCPSPDEAPLTVDACVRELLARAAARAAFVEARGDEVVSAALGAEVDALQLVRAVVRRATQQRGRLALDVDLVRARAARDPLIEALLLAAVPSGVHADAFKGPVLSEASRRLLAALPDSLVELAGEPSRRFVQERCQGSPITRALETSWLGQAQLTFKNGAETSSEPIVDAWKVERGVELALQGGRTLRVTWPTVEKNVVTLGGVAWGTAEGFPHKPAVGCTR